MIIFLHGKEKYLVFERYLQLKKDFLEKNKQASVFEFDMGEQTDLSLVFRSLSEGSGMFSQKKMIVFKDLFSSPASSQQAIQEKIEESSVADSRGIFLVVAEIHSSPAKGKLFNFLKKSAKTQEFKLLQGAQLEKWITSEVERRSDGEIGIESDAVKRVALLARDGLWEAASLVELLVSYCSKRIKLEDVLLFGSEKFEMKVFDLVDALGQRNTPAALRIKQQLLSQGQNEFLIFSMIVSQIRNLLKVAEAMAKGMPQPMIASNLGMHPFVVKKTSMQLRNFNRKKLKDVFQLGAEIDLKAKTGESNMKELLDYFIAKI